MSYEQAIAESERYWNKTFQKKHYAKAGKEREEREAAEKAEAEQYQKWLANRPVAPSPPSFEQAKSKTTVPDVPDTSSPALSLIDFASNPELVRKVSAKLIQEKKAKGWLDAEDVTFNWENKPHGYRAEKAYRETGFYLLEDGSIREHRCSGYYFFPDGFFERLKCDGLCRKLATKGATYLASLFAPL